MTDHAAVGTDGRSYQPAGAFDFEAHDRHAAAGFCPVVSFCKYWCGKQAEHHLPHSSPLLVPTDLGKAGVIWLEWDA